MGANSFLLEQTSFQREPDMQTSRTATKVVSLIKMAENLLVYPVPFKFENDLEKMTLKK